MQTNLSTWTFFCQDEKVFRCVKMCLYVTDEQMSQQEKPVEFRELPKKESLSGFHGGSRLRMQ